ncbi:hypothetical protein [Actinoplanes sp. NPDC049802]|uniref:hypothetical protein n=1 Tax=Actinoplanes sp. NPDC049802 TaxID=3154742 RepID=UPI0033F26F34
MYPSEQPAGPPQPSTAEDGPQSVAARPGLNQAWQQVWRLNDGSRRPWRRSLTVAAGVAGTIAVLGVLLGLLWAWVTPTVPVMLTSAGKAQSYDMSERYIAADGWLTLLGLGFGVLVTTGSWLLLRRDRGPFLLAGVVSGTLVAGHWVAPLVGEFIGRDAYENWKATAELGATYAAPPEVQSLGPTLIPAFVAAILLTLLAGWSNDPDLDHPGAQPGWGPNHAAYEPPYADTDHEPAAVGHEPAAVGHEPAAAGHESAAPGHEFTAAGDKSAAIGHDAAAGYGPGPGAGPSGYERGPGAGPSGYERGPGAGPSGYERGPGAELVSGNGVTPGEQVADGGEHPRREPRQPG